jgi:FKBP-type peptidyl-prolyl cis-trans isomerase
MSVPRKGLTGLFSLRYVFACAARNGWKIDSTSERKPYALIMRGGDVIAGLEEALVGMRVGGRRRCIIPSNLGYKTAKDRPVPPDFGAYQKFKNSYLNRDKPYVSDLVFDITVRSISGGS